MITTEIPTALIDPPTNPHRLDFDEDELIELSNSIKTHGLLQPILVKRNGERYTIIAGHRRWTVHKNFNLPTIRATVTDEQHDTRNQLQQIAENFDRSSLSPMEEALAIDRLAETFGGDLPSVARALHRSRAFVTARLALLDMPPELKEHVHTRALAITSALHLAQIKNDAHREYHTHHAIHSGAPEPVVREWVNQYLNNNQLDPDAPPILPPVYTEGQIPVVLMPCFLCGTPHPYQNLRIKRCCADCDAQLANTTRIPNPPYDASVVQEHTT